MHTHGNAHGSSSACYLSRLCEKGNLAKELPLLDDARRLLTRSLPPLALGGLHSHHLHNPADHNTELIDHFPSCQDVDVRQEDLQASGAEQRVEMLLTVVDMCVLTLGI